MQNSTTWVLVANSSLAKIFKVTKYPKLEIVTTLQHPESKLHDIDLVSTKPGRAFDRLGGGRHSYQQVTDPHHFEMEKFAKEVSKHLRSAFLKGDFQRLYLIASPQFLGLLRQELDNKTQSAIANTIHKDMTELTTESIEQHLEKI